MDIAGAFLIDRKVQIYEFIEDYAGNDPLRQGADLADYIIAKVRQTD